MISDEHPLNRYPWRQALGPRGAGIGTGTGTGAGRGIGTGTIEVQFRIVADPEVQGRQVEKAAFPMKKVQAAFA